MNYKRIYILFNIILFIFSYSDNDLFAQNKRKADSLLQIVIYESQSVKDRAKTLIRLSRVIKLDTALYIANDALSNAQKIGDKLLIAEAYEELGVINRRLGNTIDAFSSSFKALENYELINRSDRIADITEQIGSHYLYDRNYKKAKTYLNKALENYYEISDTLDITMTLINLGEAYRISNNLDSAEVCFIKSLEFEDYLKDELIYAYALGNLGLVHSAQGNFENAKKELEESTEILERLGDPYAASYYKSEIGKIFVNEGKHEAGEQLLMESLATAEDIGLKEQIKDINKILSEHYENIGTYDEALLFRKQYEIYADSLQNLDNVRQIESLRADQAINQKQKEVEYLDRINASTKKLNLVLGIGLFGLTTLSILLYSSFQRLTQSHKKLEVQKQVIEKREEEKALLLRELNHRVKNNLQMIASLLNLQSSQIEDKEASKALESGKMRVEALSLIHQKLYSKDHHTTIKVKEYLEELIHNLVFTFKPEVTINTNIEDIAMDIDKAIPLGLIINELCTNALKYAFTKSDSPDLDVHLMQQGENYNLTISDNGTGINQSKTNKHSFGLRLVNSLVDQLDATISQINQNGCTWNITMPG